MLEAVALSGSDTRAGFRGGFIRRRRVAFQRHHPRRPHPWQNPFQRVSVLLGFSPCQDGARAEAEEGKPVETGWKKEGGGRVGGVETPPYGLG